MAIGSEEEGEEGEDEEDEEEEEESDTDREHLFELEEVIQRNSREPLFTREDTDPEEGGVGLFEDFRDGDVPDDEVEFEIRRLMSFSSTIRFVVWLIL
jgi:hypothetical protein